MKLRERVAILERCIVLLLADVEPRLCDPFKEAALGRIKFHFEISVNERGGPHIEVIEDD